MNKETYVSAIKEQDQLIANSQDYKRLLALDYIKANRRFNDGDRVKITNSGRSPETRFAYVGGAKVAYNNEIEYILYKEKKDGTKSLVKDFVWNSDLLELSPKN